MFREKVVIKHTNVCTRRHRADGEIALTDKIVTCTDNYIKENFSR